MKRVSAIFRNMLQNAIKNNAELYEVTMWIIKLYRDIRKYRAKRGILRVIKEDIFIPKDNAIQRESSIYVRKALAFRKLLRKMPIYVDKDELIIGRQTIFTFPSYLKQGDPIPLTEIWGITPNYEIVLREGCVGIKQRVLKRIEMIRPSNIKDKNKKEQMDFLKSLIIACDAVIEFAHRYSEYLISLAKKEKDPKKKQRLLKLSEITRKVPAYPATSFHEALQSVYFTRLAISCGGHTLVGFGRLDQYLYPYYKADLEKGIIDKAYAKELLKHFWKKLNEDLERKSGVFPGDTGQTIILGGKDKNGRDMINELSHLFVEVAIELKTPAPSLVIRLHRNIDREFLKKCAKLAELGIGQPLFANDEIVIPALLRTGYREEDVYNYGVSACWETLIPGYSADQGNSGKIIFLQVLEATLNNGKSFMDNREIGVPLGFIFEYTSYGELLKAYAKQVSYFITPLVHEINTHKKLAPSPILSALMGDCIEKAVDVSKGGGRYNNWGILGASLADTADSLAVIKRLVFGKGIIQQKQLYEILKSNYDGYEIERLFFINKVPKFGNDDDYVDKIAWWIIRQYSRMLSKYRNPLGGAYKPGLGSEASYIFIAKRVGATPNGRKAGEPFAPNFSPSLGMDKKGPTATIDSITKGDLTLVPNNAVLDLSLQPWIFEGEEGIDRLISLIKTFIELGGFELQLNIIDPKVLIDAQKHPEKYQNLIVRVWGFSARFIDLPKEFQDHIIRRYLRGEVTNEGNDI